MTLPIVLISATACGTLVGVSALTAALVRRRLVVVTVDGPSMQPTFQPGDRVLVRRSEASVLRSGDVVVIQRPDDDGRWPDRADQPPWLVKRVVALPGNPLPLDRVPELSDHATTHVPPGMLVLLGDNSESSFDSRYRGYFPCDRVLGVVIRPLAHR